MENVEYPPKSPDLTPLDFFLWGALEQWYSTGGVRRHLRGCIDYTICITCIMYQQLWGYKVEEKLYLGVCEQKRLNTTALKNAGYTSKPRTVQDLRHEIWTCMYRFSISGNTERLPICCTSLSIMLCCWWWTLNICYFKCENITILSLFICELWTLEACVFFLGHCILWNSDL
jgi:hypothetical protein